MVICLERGADLHTVQLMALGLPFWYQLTRVVTDKGPLNARVCVTAGKTRAADWSSGHRSAAV